VAFESRVLLESQFGKILPGALAEGLTLLWGVDAANADAVLLFSSVENVHGVTIGNPDDSAG
jgi:hypothetical protein